MNHIDSTPCGLYWPGHGVHWIQWKKGLEGNWQEVELINLDGQYAHVRIGGEERLWRFHEAVGRVLEAWQSGEPAHLGDFGALRVGNRLIHPCHRLADWQDCRPPRHSQQPIPAE